MTETWCYRNYAILGHKTFDRPRKRKEKKMAFYYKHLTFECDHLGQLMLRGLTKLCSQAGPVSACKYGTVQQGQWQPPVSVPVYH